MIYAPAQRDGPFHFTINSVDFALGAVTGFTSAVSGTAYTLANLALFVPFSVPIPCIALEGYAVCGSVAGGNFDIGVYNAAGTRLTSSGSTARSASVAVTTTTMTNLTLDPDTVYYMAMAANGTDSYLAYTAAAGIYEALGVLEMQTAFALPSSATYVKTTRAYLPVFGLNLQATAV